MVQLRTLAHLRTLAFLSLLALISASALAMPGAGGSAPKGGATFSPPLPSAELPQGVLTIKVVGQGMKDLKVGRRVLLQQLIDGAPGAERASQTGEDGRARFEGLVQDKQYRLVVELEGQAHSSPPFLGPETGGLRLLFSSNSGGKSAHPMVPSGPAGSMGSVGPAGTATAPQGMGAPRRQDPHQGMGDPHRQSPHRRDEGQGAALVEPAPDLKVGEVQVQVGKGTKKTPVPHIEVKISGQEKPRWRTDQGGTALITPRPQDGGVGPFLVRFQEMTYRSGVLQLPEKGGLKVTFTVFDRTPKPDHVTLGRGSHLVCQVGEGAINVMQVLELVNESEAIFDPGTAGYVIPLPSNAVRVEVPAELREFLRHDPHSSRLRLMAPLTPGRTVLRVFYELRYQGSELDVQQTMTLPASESVLMVVNNEQVNLLGPSVQRERDFAPDKRQERIFGLAPVKKGATLEFTLTDLPHRDTRLIYAAVAVAGMIMLWALLAAWAGPRRAAQRGATREALLDQLTKLDRASSKSKQDQARREELLHDLRREWDA